MFPEKIIWCPNVILLNEQTESPFAHDSLVQIVNALLKDIPFVFVAIGDFSETLKASQIVIEQNGYSIYKEDNSNLLKLTSKIMGTGIQHTYYIQAQPETIKPAFVHFLDILGNDFPIICFAPGLSNKLQPALKISYHNTQEIELTFFSTIQKINIEKTFTIQQLVNLDIQFISRKIETSLTNFIP